MIVSMLTTIDNKFDPFDDFDNWYSYDDGEKQNLVHQYFGCNSCQLLDRFSKTSSEMAPIFAEEENERAIDEICDKFEMFGIFKKVQKKVS